MHLELLCVGDTHTDTHTHTRAAGEGKNKRDIVFM